MRPLAEDTFFDRLLRFLLGAAIGMAWAVAILGVDYVIIGHVHQPLLVMALFGIGGGIIVARRVPRA